MLSSSPVRNAPCGATQRRRWAAKRVGETTLGIDLHQGIFNAYERKRALNRVAQMCDPGWEFEGIAAFQVQMVMADGREVIAQQPTFSVLGHRIECTLETRDKVVGPLGELEFGIRQSESEVD
jgi:hypothetical protein